MKRNATQHGQATDKDSTSSVAAQLFDLRERVWKARKAFLALGTEDYMSFIAAQATRENTPLTSEEYKAIQQVMNGRAFANDADRLDLVERALAFQQAA